MLRWISDAPIAVAHYVVGSGYVISSLYAQRKGTALPETTADIAHGAHFPAIPLPRISDWLHANQGG